MPDIVIIGAGPTGLGAAWHLNKLEYSNWLLLEKNSEPGGLASSVKDKNGFLWDLGCHILYSHYEYFDQLMDELLDNHYLLHERQAWVWVENRFIPYPFQNNIGRLSKATMWKCLQGIIQNYTSNYKFPPRNFKEWIYATFGDGICRYFMEPYNLKVWAYPLENLAYKWIGERVAPVDLERVVYNVIYERDDPSWGPNDTFRFPLYGGTGKIWRTLASKLPKDHIRYNATVNYIDTKNCLVKTSSGDEIPYKYLISTMPLDCLIENSNLKELEPYTRKLLHSSVHVVGIGLKGEPPEQLRNKCWMYFPESYCPFYRATVFSNYSPNNVPDIANYWSIMFEVSESPKKPIEQRKVVEEVIQGALDTRLISSREHIVTVWYSYLPYAYPTPSLERDTALLTILPALEKENIYSRGRFGGWRYEVGNMDHSLMQGLECVNRILFGLNEVTLWHPEVVNEKRPPSVTN